MFEIPEGGGNDTTNAERLLEDLGEGIAEVGELPRREALHCA